MTSPAFLRRKAFSQSRLRPPSLVSSSDSVIKRFKHYQLGNQLGKGAFGHVFCGLNLKTGEVVAVKQIRKELVAPDKIPGILREIELLLDLDHENIVKLLDFEDTPEILYLVLEYIEGGSLYTISKKFGPFNEDLLALYMVQVLKGLEYLHSHHVIHRDVKGANILLSKQGVCKLADFGSCTIATANRKLTVVGTPFWMAPEIISHSSEGGFASDIWSLGCTILELLTGSAPYWELGPNVALFRMVEDDHPPFPSTLSAKLRDFLESVFIKDVSKRCTASELLQHAWLQNACKDSAPDPNLLARELANSSGRERSMSLENIFKKPSGLDTIVNLADASCDGDDDAEISAITQAKKKSEKANKGKVDYPISLPIDIPDMDEDQTVQELGLSPRQSKDRGTEFLKSFSFFRKKSGDESPRSDSGTQKQKKKKQTDRNSKKAKRTGQGSFDGNETKSPRASKKEASIKGRKSKSDAKIELARTLSSGMKTVDSSPISVSDEMKQETSKSRKKRESKIRRIGRGKAQSSAENVPVEYLHSSASSIRDFIDQESSPEASETGSPLDFIRSPSPVQKLKEDDKNAKSLSRTISDKLVSLGWSPRNKRKDSEDDDSLRNRSSSTPTKKQPREHDLVFHVKLLTKAVEKLIERQLLMENELVSLRQQQSLCEKCGKHAESQEVTHPTATLPGTTDTFASRYSPITVPSIENLSEGDDGQHRDRAREAISKDLTT